MPSFTSIFKTLVGLLIGIILLECLLQILPTATGFERENDDFPIRHWKPDSTYVYSNGWNFRNPQSGRVNNYGFVNVKDYTAGGADVLVLGDSYIEAQQVPQNMTLHAVIEQETSLSTYAIGINDSQFADYINYMQYGLSEFKPTWLVVKLFESDLSSSDKNHLPQGAYFITENEEISLKVNPSNKSQSGLRNALKQSALLRYLFLNLRLPAKIKQFVASISPTPNKDSTTVVNYQKLLDFFYTQLEQHHFSKERVIFITDSQNVESLLRKNALKYVNSTTLIDTLFAESGFRGNDFPYDGHWNFRGHYLVGQSVAKLIIGENAP
ncbi:hypothetical protein KIH87_04620 [Paraneptunicella aestuarii]|uniref:hypothetical protein n=1 Tax=Paraneptunicella aestuarii TaxID=2831148 RepID=UPI001E432FE6|nr:hypothetical protein [Paraneptunicella aestuarii]UAA39646.1 hypothetical protein KIH87_04620 [Paraneptunicella aestuarii]